MKSVTNSLEKHKNIYKCEGSKYKENFFSNKKFRVNNLLLKKLYNLPQNLLFSSKFIIFKNYFTFYS